MATTNRKTPATEMSPAVRQELARTMADPLSDEQNAAYTFSCTHSWLLLALASGVVDARGLARREMANRGLDANGDNCSFAAATKIWAQAPQAAAGGLELAQVAAHEIAGRLLKISLVAQGSDGADFHEVSVWALREALVAAYQAGAASK
jgi:hypothetical protein